MSSQQPVPQRIGDVERDQAAAMLREHMAVGRLDQLEFDERLSAALSARTAADLEPLFADLPDPRPGGSVLPADIAAPPWQRTPAAVNPPSPAPLAPAAPAGASKGLAIASTFAWPVVILFITFVAGWSNFWWLVFIPIVLSSLAGNHHQAHRRRELGH